MGLMLIPIIDELIKDDKTSGFSCQHLFKTQPIIKSSQSTAFCMNKETPVIVVVNQAKRFLL